MNPISYEVCPETRDGIAGYRICLIWRDQLFPLPGYWYRNSEIAALHTTHMEREDQELLQKRNKESQI